jgi:hypothetical protein
MELLHCQISVLAKSENRPHQLGPVRYFAVRAVCLAGFASLGLAAYVARSEDTLPFPFDPGFAALNLVHPMAGINPQMVSSPPIVKVKIIEGFNKKRERDIANDSERLLSLAIALKAELDNGDRPVEAAAKANEIEKLARTVKHEMSHSPLPGPMF